MFGFSAMMLTSTSPTYCFSCMLTSFWSTLLIWVPSPSAQHSKQPELSFFSFGPWGNLRSHSFPKATHLTAKHNVVLLHLCQLVVLHFHSHT